MFRLFICNIIKNCPIGGGAAAVAKKSPLLSLLVGVGGYDY
jgi:Na+-transporting NADH:ubiquinone oxidoreductase subunit NqrD